MGSQIDRLRTESRFDVACRLKQNHWNGTVAPQLVVRRVFDSPARYEELRAWLAGLWRDGESTWTPEARVVFDELGLSAGGRRQLLESEAFRAMLAEPALELPRAA